MFCVRDFKCGVCGVLIYFSSLLPLVPPDSGRLCFAIVPFPGNLYLLFGFTVPLGVIGRLRSIVVTLL